jgi:hexosaminidase
MLGGDYSALKRNSKKAYRHRKFGAEFQSEEYAFIDDLDQPVALWTNLLVEEGIHRNSLYQRDNPIENAIITLPDYEQTGKWSEKYTSRLSALKLQYEQLKIVQEKQERLYQETQKSSYNLEVYSQIVKLVGYNFRLMQALNDFDLAETDEEKNKQLLALQKYPAEFEDIRAEFETVYSQTRRLEKPKNYILDQDHHRHPANQTRNFDWQFSAELFLLEKLENHFKTQPYLGEGQQQRLQ